MNADTPASHLDHSARGDRISTAHAALTDDARMSTGGEPAVPGLGPTRAGAAFADAAAARAAVELLRPSLEAALSREDVSGRGVLFIVILDPACGPRDASFERAVLHEAAIGDRTRWDVDYAWYAREKARVAWRDAVTGEHPASAAHRLRDGDSLLEGAACVDGIVVAASGAMPWYDRAFAAMVAAALRAEAQRRYAEARHRGEIAAVGGRCPVDA